MKRMTVNAQDGCLVFLKSPSKPRCHIYLSSTMLSTPFLESFSTTVFNQLKGKPRTPRTVFVMNGDHFGSARHAGLKCCDEKYHNRDLSGLPVPRDTPCVNCEPFRPVAAQLKEVSARCQRWPYPRCRRARGYRGERVVRKGLRVRFPCVLTCLENTPMDGKD